MHNNGGCVQRVSGPVGGILYSVCSSASGLIAVGGTDRAVTIYDPRKLVFLFIIFVLLIQGSDKQLCGTAVARVIES
jgi:hypothetical protein